MTAPDKICLVDTDDGIKLFWGGVPDSWEHVEYIRAEATPKKLVLKNELTGEVVVEKTIPEHMRGADPEIACACMKLLSAGWTLIAPGFEEVDLEKELDTWRHEHFHGKRDGYFNGEYLERSSQLALASYFFNLGLNSKK